MPRDQAKGAEASARYRAKPDYRAKHAAWRRRWRLDNPGRDDETQQRYYERNKAAYVARARTWNAAHPERRQVVVEAKTHVRNAIRRGALVRPSGCEECLKACRPEAAHRDYTKPLDVRWLCRACHVRWDRAEPKSV